MDMLHLSSLPLVRTLLGVGCGFGLVSIVLCLNWVHSRVCRMRAPRPAASPPAGAYFAGRPANSIGTAPWVVEPCARPERPPRNEASTTRNARPVVPLATGPEFTSPPRLQAPTTPASPVPCTYSLVTLTVSPDRRQRKR